MSLFNLDQFRTLFSPRRSSPGRDVVVAGGRLGRREWVLPRAKLVYHRFDLGDVPPARRAQALQLKLDSWRPVPEPRYWTGWQGGVAQVWAWSEQDAELSPPNGQAAVPESALMPPGVDEARLVACLQGCEGQVWRGGKLQQSRWWQRPPSPRDWQAFQRAARQAPTDVPEPQQLAWQTRPWARASASGQGWWTQNERALVTGGALALALVAGWQLGGLWKAQRALALEQARLETLQQASATELAARDRALAEQTRAAELLDLLPPVDALSLLDQVTAVLPPGTRLRDWRFAPDQLVLTLEAAEPPDPETAVRAFEAVDVLDGVLAERGRVANTLELRATLAAESSR